MLQHGSPRQRETSATPPAPPAGGGRGGGVAAQHGSLRRQPGVNAGPNTAARTRVVNDPRQRHGHAFFRPVYGSFRRRRFSARASARVSKATRNFRHSPAPPASGGRGGGVAAQHGSLRRQPGVNAGPSTAARKRAVNDPHQRHSHSQFRPVYGSFRRRRSSARALARVSKATRNARHSPRPARLRRAGRGSGGSTRVFASATRRKRRAEHRCAERVVNDLHQRHGHAFFRPVYGSFRRRRSSARASARVSKATRNFRHSPRPARLGRAGAGSGGSTRICAFGNPA